MAAGDIPIRNMPGVSRTEGTPLIGTAGIAQVGQAQQRLAGAIGQAGDAAMAFAQKRQRTNDVAAESDEQLGITATNEKIDVNLQSEEYRNDHEKWVDMGTDLWDQRSQAMEENLTKYGVSDEAAETIRTRYSVSREKSLGRLTEQALARDWELKMTTITMSAQDYYRNEMWDAGDRKIDSIGLPEPEAEALKFKLKHEADYQMAEQELRSMVTPDDYKAFMDMLMVKEGEGDESKFVNYKGLQPDSRRTLLGYADARMRTALRDQASTLRTFNKALASGNATDDDIKVAAAKGTDPFVVEQMQRAMEAKTVYEENTTEYQKLADEMTLSWYHKGFGMDWVPAALKKDIPEEAYNKQLKKIADSDFTPASKRKLVDLWLDWRYQDAVEDGQLMLAGFDEKVNLDDADKRKVTDMFDMYKEANGYGDWAPEAISGIANEQLRDLFMWIHNTKDITEDMWSLKLNDYRSQIFGKIADEQASQEAATGDMFGF